MKKLFLFNILFLFNYSILAQSNFATEINSKSKLGLYIIPKLGFGKISETGNVPLYGFLSGGDAIISIGLTKKMDLLTGLGYFEFYGNSISAENTSSFKNSYLQIPLKIKTYKIMFENETKKQYIFSTAGLGFYTNTLLHQKIESILGNRSQSNLGWNYGITIQWGMKFDLSKNINFEIGYQFQHDLSKMEKNNIERKIDNLNTIYLEFKL